MTEAEWLACTNPRPMLEFLRGKASERKLRLFSCACCRLVWHILPSLCHQLVEAVEHHAEKEIRRDDLVRLFNMYRNQIVESTVPGGNQAVEAISHLGMPWRTAEQWHAEWYEWQTSYSVARSAAESLAKLMPWQEARQREGQLLHDIFGSVAFRPVSADPSWLVWNGDTVTALAQTIYTERAFDRLPILADALEDAGCTNQDILAHCRSGGDHTRGCWVVDLLTGRE